MNPLFAAAIGFEAFCRAQGWRLCIIGGTAVQRWGDPRQTRDLDVTILTGLGGEARFVDTVLGAYRGRIPEARALHALLLLKDDPEPEDRLRGLLQKHAGP